MGWRGEYFSPEVAVLRGRRQILKRNKKRNGDHHWEDFKTLMNNETVRDTGKEQTPTALRYQPYYTLIDSTLNFWMIANKVGEQTAKIVGGTPDE